jgi:integrase
MLPATVSVPAAEPRAGVLAAYGRSLAAAGHGNIAFERAARSFLRRWPDPQRWAALPLSARSRANTSTLPFLTFLMLTHRLQPGYDYLVARKLSSLWRYVPGSPLQPDLKRFATAALELGFTERVASAVGSQITARLLIQTARPLTDLTEDDLQQLMQACRERQDRTGRGWRHYASGVHTVRQVLFHLGVLPNPTTPRSMLVPLPERMADVSDALRGRFVAYLQRKSVTCKPRTVSSLATRLAGFGRFLNNIDPELISLTELDRCRHIEPFLNSMTSMTNSVTGAPITVADQARRVNAAANFLSEITEWGWPDAPGRRLFFRTDNPRLPRPLPRYLPVDADRKLTQELAVSTYRLAADALLLQRACGLRIGELMDLEIDCVHEVPGQGSWLKVPLGKLDTERMVPLDEETLTLLDRIAATRSGGRPIRHPRTGRPAEFLFTHHGQRLSQNAVREELARAADRAGIGHVHSHQLRHTYATALVNAGVSLQALMALLGHSSAEMSLRYARLFDATVRLEYERALDLAKSQIGPLPTGRRTLPLADITHGTDWKDTPTIKSRMAGGYCLRAPAQGACPYANICEHCPNFRTEPTHLQVLAAQRIDAAALAADAQARGWITETERHNALLARLDALIAQTQCS